jgi:hypothetical protein
VGEFASRDDMLTTFENVLSLLYSSSGNMTTTSSSLTELDMWIPYQRRDQDSLTYISIYNSSQLINSDLWGPGLPTPGKQ